MGLCPLQPRSLRDRYTIGNSNRWRFHKEQFSGDLLGLSQVCKALNVDFDDLLRKPEG